MPRLTLVEQPPEMCVYKRNIKPMPAVAVGGVLPDAPARLCVVPMLYRCDTNADETPNLAGREFAAAAPGKLVVFKRLKILVTSRMLCDSLVILAFELRCYRRFSPAAAFAALAAASAAASAPAPVPVGVPGTVLPPQQLHQPQQRGTLEMVDDGNGLLRPVTLCDLDNPAEYTVLHSVISHPITVVSHSTQLRSSFSSSSSSEGASTTTAATTTVTAAPGGPRTPRTAMQMQKQMQMQQQQQQECRPVVQDVVPRGGPACGGARVVVLGAHFRDTPAVRVCFGDAEVVPTVLGPRTLVCTAPPHAPGFVPITVRNDSTHASSFAKEAMFFYD